MPFHSIPKNTTTVGRAALLAPTIAADKTGVALVRLPRALLRDAGLSDFPSAKFDVLLGDGEDAGKISIVNGDRFTSFAGKDKTPKSIAVSVRLATARFPAATCVFAVQRKALLIMLPAGFPLRADMSATAAPARSTSFTPSDVLAAARAAR